MNCFLKWFPFNCPKKLFQHAFFYSYKSKIDFWSCNLFSRYYQWVAIVQTSQLPSQKISASRFKAHKPVKLIPKSLPINYNKIMKKMENQNKSLPKERETSLMKLTSNNSLNDSRLSTKINFLQNSKKPKKMISKPLK